LSLKGAQKAANVVLVSETFSRPCRPQDTLQWAEFLNRNFGYGPGQSYAVDFAPLFDQAALPLSQLVWKDEQIAASASLYPVVVVTPMAQLKLGVVGAVATDQQFRGQGLSTQVLKDIEQAALAKGLEGLILWSDQTEFYAKSGYAPVGRQIICSLENLPAPYTMAHGTAVYGWDWTQVRILYTRHSLRVARTEAHWKSLESIQSCTRLQWLDNEGRVKAYIGFDRGHDLKGIIHEWGGEAKALHCLLWTILQNRPSLMWLTHPDLNDPILPLLPEVRGTEGTLALFKSLSPAVLPEDLDQAWFWGLDSL
jgi:predicted N-acetyltransferase YhbS